MIGTLVRGTLWVVAWRHLALEAPPDGARREIVIGHTHVITADPSGSDLYDVAQAAVLNGKARAELEFTILDARQLAEVKGRAIAAGGAN